MKISKKHKGKEFHSYFHFVGQVKKHIKGSGDNAEIKPIYEVTQTKTHKPRRVVQFDLFTTKFNKLKIDMGGMEFDTVTLWSSSAKKPHRIPWVDRLDKSKYPDSTYTLIGGTDWDNAEAWGNLLAEGMWVEVKGRYEFDTYTNEEGKEFLTVKRRPTLIEVVKDGDEIPLHNKETVKYVCDFDSEDFREINHFNMEIGIKSTYQDENTQDTRVNAVFLAYGTEASVPKDVELIVYYKEPTPGKTALADAFSNLGRLDFVEVRGIDNNRPEFGEVVEESEVDDDPFANVEEQEASTRRVITGNRRGLEILSVVTGTTMKSMLTEAEIASESMPEFAGDDSFGDDDSDEDPF